MPLSDPAPRRRIHTRAITVDGYRREDGLWDIEAVLTDVKAYDFDATYRGRVLAGEPVHDIKARLVVDDSLTIRQAEAVIDNSPFPICPAIGPAFAGLAGLNLGKGFMREVRARFGGIDGCVHVSELMGAMATTAFQTIYPLLREEKGDGPGRPALIDSCHAFAADGEVVARLWPDHSTRAASGPQGSTT